MSVPSATWSFAERLEWLIATVPRVPGRAGRFSTVDLVNALASAVPRDAPGGATGVAREWLDARRAGAEVPSGDWTSQRFVAALEEVFRLPMGYFQDPALAAATDERISFAHGAAAGGLRLIGPCRALRSELTAEQMHRLHGEVVAALHRRRAVS